MMQGLKHTLCCSGDAMDLTRRQREQRKKEIRNKVNIEDIEMIFILMTMKMMMMKFDPSIEDNNQANAKIKLATMVKDEQ